MEDVDSSVEPWVQCDKPECQKWRKVDCDIDLTLNSDKKWYCWMNSGKEELFDFFQLPIAISISHALRICVSRLSGKGTFLIESI